MRCPKCGYISFDRQRSCGKCSNDLTAVAEQLQGTAGKAAAPFFLGAVLGQQTPVYNEQSSALHEDEEEETLALDELEAEAPVADEEELDFAGAPLDEDDLQDQPLPSLGLEDIDVSDLVPPREEEEEPVLSLEDDHTEASLAQEAEDSLMGMDLPSLEPEDLFGVGEHENLPSDRGNEAEPSSATEDEEIIDLSSLMGFEETPANQAAAKEDRDVLDLSFGDAPEELHLSLDDGEHPPAPAEAPKKTASTLADIPDLGLTLENDDQ
ncbi:MAG: hypothetical protein D9V46_02660 [Deltaproteobacteria bacterium]|uniref:hypothetical protein n=1 Tax=Hydrosulfovibrio ferrireducens TaxID=2934181 RepID=UPI00120172C5|nr:MAG: hypothetical protein D9V46_02660 [Deltaproteobacteria bacterium]